KACGGGVQQRAAQRIPFDFSSVVRGRLSGFELTFNFGQNCLRTYPDDLVYSVLRSEFDQFLLAQAVRAGAHVQHGVKVLGVSSGPQSAEIQTSAGALSARYVIGADGANSVIGRLLNQRDNYFWQAALYCEVPEEHLAPGGLAYQNMRVDWGTLPSGYAWIFPKVGSANIGVGCPAALGRMLRPYLKSFISAEGILKSQALESLRFKGHQLPTLTKRTVLENSSVMLVGDAAGLVEPFTGDGISQACHSAELAAESILDSLDNRCAQRTYTQKVLREIGSELIWSRKLLSLAVTFPHALYRAFKINDRVWNTFCRVLRAEESFKSVKAAALGPLELLCTPIEFIVERYEKRKIHRFSSEQLAKPA
ncbi:MAG: NAD(P)/FAD-dependent oxidoreductase, partial [Acidobacteriaceae bacterium]|nr:NAD(P)/FAD-dependent oxidoreductase [Acidobacteriaceae bacterium]